MAYNTYIADRISRALSQANQVFEAKKMMGGLCFMVNDKMCIGVHEDRIMARVGPDQYEDCLAQPGCTEMNFTGKPMNGFVFVEGQAIVTDKQLTYWLEKCLNYNPIAKSSKKRSKN
ncbi:TfoX/Sxy family protein [Echinicola jeungdonensis]|uniref:TfoX/Sxy family protein n=1 Tax=Echinicola jeungdonensis TaxID=709343 RepID=A0ABV5J029_9BACT|nr:TfoX/Sxy family protein [Echinicola jeungdonensis]MDN3669206.1 TfoX/Sxy family protein [Echinicola jeungdonensis]